MRQRILRLTGQEANIFGAGTLTKEFMDRKGIPADAKVVRRYFDVVSGQPASAIVFEHPSFDEVEAGGLIPEFKPVSVVEMKQEPALVEKPVEQPKQKKGKHNR
jgi:hypothetical protein